MYIDCNWRDESVTSSFGLGVYGKQEVKFEKVIDQDYRQFVQDGKETEPNTQGTSLGNLFAEAFQDNALASPLGWVHAPDFGVYKGVSTKLEQSNNGYGIYVVRNNSKGPVEVTLKMGPNT